jgi:hypothetical protein
LPPQQLGLDTVEAVVWSLSEVEALLLDRSMRSGDHETALEEGWLLVELEQRFNYGLEELARRFDRSTSWVSRRMSLVELLPESVQQQVRDGAIAAHVAMKFLVPVARSRSEDCRRMAEGFARYRLSSREAGQLYAAWRTSTAAVRERLLNEPQLFLKTQREHAVDPPSPAMVELGRDLEVVAAIARRANRRLSGTTLELDTPQCAETHSKIHRAIDELGRLAAKIPHQPNSEQQGAEDVESESAIGDSGVEHQKGEQARDSSCAEGEESAMNQQPSGREAGVPTDRSSSVGREDYVRKALEAYRNTPGTCGNLRRPDRTLAVELYQRGVPLHTVENALVLAAVRRLIRPADAPPLTTVRSLAYFLPVIEEVLETEVGEEYFQYARQKLQRLRSS